MSVTVGLSDKRKTVETALEHDYGQITVGIAVGLLSDCRTVGLSDCRKLSDYCRTSTVGLSDQGSGKITNITGSMVCIQNPFLTSLCVWTLFAGDHAFF